MTDADATDPLECNNGPCLNPATGECESDFCIACCDEKCSLNCPRQLALVPDDELPRF